MWVLFTFAAVFLWSLVNIADSYLVEKNRSIGHPIGSLVIFSSLFGFVAAGAIYFFADAQLGISLKNLVLVMVAGFCNLLWIIFYLNALKDDDVSAVVPWFLTAPLFGYILGYFILGERLSFEQIIGGLVIIGGGIILSIKSKKEEEKRTYHIRWKPILLMTTASFLIAIWGILFKYVAQDSGFWTSSFWEHIGLGVAGIFVIILMKSYREGFSDILKKEGKLVLKVSLFSETATIVGNLLANYAILFVPVTMVLLLEVAQPAVVFILGLICTLFFPKILTEDVSTRNILQKVISIVVMTLGALLLT